MVSPATLSMPEPTDDIEQGKRNLDQFGVTIHKNFLNQQQVREVRARLEEQAELECERGVATFGHRDVFSSGKPDGQEDFQAVYLLANKGRVFIDVAKHPVARAYAEHAFRGLQYKVGAQLGYIVRKGALAHPLHRDQGPIPFPTPMPLTLVAAIALGEYDEDMGATRIVPGSHRWLEQEPPPPEQTVPVVLEPGSAALWEGRVWHAQGGSTSDKTRYSMVTNYAIHFLSTFDCYPASIHDDVHKVMSDEELTLYGFKFNGVSGRIESRMPGDPRGNAPYIPELRRGS